PEVLVAKEERSIPPVFGDYEFVTQGEQVYGRYCSVCHGPAAVSPDTGTFPDLRFSKRLGETEAWRSVVIGGELTSGGMVSFKEQLTTEDAVASRAFVVREANLGQ